MKKAGKLQTPIYFKAAMIYFVADKAINQIKKRAAYLIHETLEQYEDLINNIDGVVWETDADLNFTFVSKRAETLFGYPVRQWKKEKKFWASHIFHEDREWVVNYCHDQCGRLLPHDIEYRFVASDGSVKWVRDLVTIIMKDGELAGMRGIMVDITKNKKTEEELQKTVSLLEATFDATADGIVVMDLNGEILNYNQNFLKLWNVPAEIVDTRNVEGLLNYLVDQLVDPEQFRKNVDECFNHSDKDILDTVVFKNGKILERESKPQFLNGKIIGRVSSFRDITIKHQIDKQKERILNEETEARIGAEKSVQLRDDFLSIASHELRTPLTPIKMQIRLLQRKIDEVLPKDTAESLRIQKIFIDTERQFNRFLKLIDDLLDVSRITANRLIIEKEKLNLSELLLEKINFLQEQYKKAGSEIITYIQPDIIGCWDKMRMEQIINNLLSNAKKYGNNKPIEVTLSQKEDKMIQLIVKDYGIGIEVKDQERVFARFERIAPMINYGGLGLGLYITQNIIVAHGGKIWVESELNKGSRFIVELPIE